MALDNGVAVLIAQLNKQLAKDGKPLIKPASEMVVPKTFTSGLLSLDVCLGGGWPGNQWVEVYGKESNGKTSIILRTIAANQAIDPNFTTFWVASEHYDTEWAAKNGIDNDRIHVIATSNMELAYEMIIQAAKSHEFDCIVLDSYPALSASEEEDKSMEQNTMTLGARRTGQFFRKIGGLYSEERPYIGIFVNQLRDAVGSFSPYGTPTTTPGGKAKNYAFYQRLLVSRDEWIEEKVEGQGKVAVGQRNKYKMEKNKAAAPRAVAMGDFYFLNSEKGFTPGQFDLVKDIVTMAVLFQVVKRAGAWFSYIPEGEEEPLKWNGAAAMTEYIRSNLELQAEITRVTLEIATQ